MSTKIAKRSFIYLSLLATFALIFCGCNKADKPVTPLTDIDGNTYKTVKIGTQTWMAENLKTSRFNNGTYIPLITDADAWANLSTPGFCWYNNDSVSFKEIYGALYNGYTINTWNICPAGWHVPEKQEWLTLRDFLGDSLTGGGKLKETGTSHWVSPNTGASNLFGFTARPGGYRTGLAAGSFRTMGYYGYWWAGTEDNLYNGRARLMTYDASEIASGAGLKKNGYSVRCVK